MGFSVLQCVAVCCGVLQIYRALLRIHGVLLRIFRALVLMYSHVLRIYRALLRMYRDVLRICGDLES